jgi:hypothetical protein
METRKRTRRKMKKVYQSMNHDQLDRGDRLVDKMYR